jgi:EmrB/QacA subfamily drug resistance transporter
MHTVRVRVRDRCDGPGVTLTQRDCLVVFVSDECATQRVQTRACARVAETNAATDRERCHTCYEIWLTDNNVTNVAIPTIQRSLHLSIAGLEWVVSSYVLVFAGLMLVGGRLADSYGRRRLFYAGTVLFTLSSLTAGLAGSGGMLIAARLAQGLGAALLVPTTLAIIIATFTDARERVTAIGLWTAIGAMALAFGPLIGGFISQHLHWGWIFFINVPVGIIAIVIAALSMAESRDPGAAGRLDLPGMVTSSIALFGLTYGLIEGHDKGWTSAVILGAFAISAAAMAAFVIIEARTERPMVDLSLFRSRVFSGGTVTMMLWAFGIFGIYFFTSIYLQDILGFSPTKAGLAFVPMALCLALAATLAGVIYTRLGTHRTVAAGMLAMAGGLYLFSMLGAGATFASLMPGFVIFGFGAGLMQVPLTNAILHGQSEASGGIASAVVNATRELAGLLGITVIGAILRARQSGALASGVHPAGAFLDGYHLGLVVTVGLIAAGAVISFLALRRLPAAVPAEVQVRPEEPELVGSGR